MRTFHYKDLGPGLLFAGAAIGVSHLVQSTKAGAEFGLSFLWVLLFVNLFKYPFFLFGAKYTAITKESLLDGYLKIGKPFLWIYFILNLFTIFTIQAAVTLVTAGIIMSLFDGTNIFIWALGITIICSFLLTIGKFKLLDRFIKFIIITLTISTFFALYFAFNNTDIHFNWTQQFPKEAYGITFLIAFMGWMPAPLDVSIWNSLWITEKTKSKTLSTKKIVFDFNIGYFGTIILAFCFLFLGYLVMYNSGETFSPKAGIFAKQLIDLYTKNLGEHFYYLIGIAAFTTMLSTTLTTLDASPRAMAKTTSLLFPKKSSKNYYRIWMIILIIGTLLILKLFVENMGTMIKIATILSFASAPFYAIMNFYLINSQFVDKMYHPKIIMKTLSVLGILFLLSFSIGYILFII
ncbi:uncharacterized protein UJ101_00329 [Flavobacteriaceae bacterium UJ101]|nr:uncharacterized protein UJ101_00329 [Flavobacteriaceae bacterium UJ101]